MFTAESYDLFDEGVFVSQYLYLSIYAAQCICHSTQALVICLPDGQGEIAGMLWQVGLILFCFPQF